MKIDGLNTDITLAFTNGVTMSISGMSRVDSPANEHYEPFALPDDDVFAYSAPAPRAEAFRGLNMQEQKRRLLEHYAEREPKRFRQFDVFTDALADCVMEPDEDGDCIFGGATYELMNGCWDVRCLINPKLNKADAVRSLRKVLECIERDGVMQGGAS
jgi:hypothetical protein